MNSELILRSDVLDMLFEKRNKNYGAYTLRKFYNNRLIKSIAIMLLTVIVFSAFTFLPDSDKEHVFEITEAGFGQVLPDPKVPELKPKVTKPPAGKAVPTLKLSSTVQIVNDKDSVDVLKNLDNRAIGSVTSIEPGEEGKELVGASGTGNEVAIEAPKPAEPVVDVTTPLESAEIKPEFPGGVQALRKFLERNLRNPRELEKDELISVKVRFVVGYDGKLQRFEIAQDGGSEFNNEVMRVLKKMPAWNPGKSHGQNVSVYYVIPVKFIAED